MDTDICNCRSCVPCSCFVPFAVHCILLYLYGSEARHKGKQTVIASTSLFYAVNLPKYVEAEQTFSCKNILCTRTYLRLKYATLNTLCFPHSTYRKHEQLCKYH